MTILKCSATTCMYNENHLCSRGEIDVMGESAHQSDETSCGSFRERNENASTNTGKEHCGCETIQIDCKAQNCTYNESCKCTAAVIDVSGPHAAASQETKCATFDCKCR